MLRNIGEHPRGYESLSLKYRRAFLETFPFVAVYEFDGQLVEVLAVMPTRGDPAALEALTKR